MICGFLGQESRPHLDNVEIPENIHTDAQTVSCEARAALACVMRTAQGLYHIAGRELYRRLDLKSSSFTKVVAGFFDLPPPQNVLSSLAMGSRETRQHILSPANRKCQLFKYVKHLNIVDLVAWSKEQQDLLDLGQCFLGYPLLGNGTKVRIFPNLEVVTIRPSVHIELADLYWRGHFRPPFLHFLARERPRRACVAYPTVWGRASYPGPIRECNLPTCVGGKCVNERRHPNDSPWTLFAGESVDDRNRKRYDSLQSGIGSCWLQWLCEHWQLDSLTLHHWWMVAGPCFRVKNLRLFAALDGISDMWCWATPYSLRFLAGEHEAECGGAPTTGRTAEQQPEHVEIANVGLNVLHCGCLLTYVQALDAYKDAMSRHFANEPFSLSMPHWWDAPPCECCGNGPSPTDEPVDRLAVKNAQETCPLGPRCMESLDTDLLLAPLPVGIGDGPNIWELCQLNDREELSFW